MLATVLFLAIVAGGLLCAISFIVSIVRISRKQLESDKQWLKQAKDRLDRLDEMFSKESDT